MQQADRFAETVGPVQEIDQFPPPAFVQHVLLLGGLKDFDGAVHAGQSPGQVIRHAANDSAVPLVRRVDLFSDAEEIALAIGPEPAVALIPDPRVVAAAAQ